MVSFFIVVVYVGLALVQEPKKPSSKQLCFTGIVVAKKENDYGITLELQAKNRILVTGNINDHQLGDSIQVCGELQLPNTNKNFHLFSYRNYLLGKGIEWQLNAKTSKQLKKNASFFYTQKRHILAYLSRYQSASYLKTFLLGDQSGFDHDIKEAYQKIGVSHLFSVSGMHVSFLTAGLLLFLDRRKTKKHMAWLISILVFFYAWLTGFSPSILRASFLFFFCTLKKMYSFTFSNHLFLFYLFLLFLLKNPYYCYHTGFLYSFLISFTLLYYEKQLRNYRSYFKKLFMTSLIAFLIGIPISLFFQFEIYPASIFYNLFFVPVVTFFLFPMMFLLCVFPFLDPFVFFCIQLLETVVLFCSNHTFSFIVGYPGMLVIGYLVGSFYAVRGLIERKRKYFVLLILCFLIQFFFPYLDGRVHMTMLDVGQGDSILLELPYRNGVLLMDTGGKNFVKGEYSYPISQNILLPYLKMRGIRKIDFLILTHGDVDHMGDAIHLVENFKVEKVIFNNGEFNDLELELIKTLEKKNIPYYQNRKELNIKDNKLYFLNNKIYDNENDNSIVLYTKINNHKLLFMGDAGTKVEQNLIEKYDLETIDILKVGHHGSKTSSSEGFINQIDPKFSLISVGENNRYGHPNHEVLDTLDKSKIYRTDEDGSILFKFKKDQLEVSTCLP